jgi:CheY-like chemotaxis protein
MQTLPNKINTTQEFEQILDETDDPKSTLATAIISPSTTDSKFDSKETIGLGLAVVARYVRNMNGQIRVRSEIGKGTIFGIELPFEHAPEATDAAMPSSGKFLPSISEVGSAYGDSDKMISGSVLSAFTDTPLATPVDEGLVGATSFPDLIVLGSSADPMSASTDGGKFASFPPNPSLAYDTMTRKPLSILVAEDNPINAKLLDRRLDKLGHKIEIVNDGQACHDFYQLERDNVDVILMDLQVCYSSFFLFLLPFFLLPPFPFFLAPFPRLSSILSLHQNLTNPTDAPSRRSHGHQNDPPFRARSPGDEKS